MKNITTIKRFVSNLTCTLLAITGLLVLSAPASHAASGAFTFSASTYLVVEGAGKVNITINRVGGSTGAATVGFRTGLISAVNDQDYVGMPLSTLSFASGVTQKVVSVGIIDDKVIEPTETFKVLLSAPTGGATLGSITSAIITLRDNDTIAVDATAPTVSLTSPASGVALLSAQPLTMAASAADNVGVSKVEFYAGATLIGSDSTAPYSFAWAVTSANNGSHSLTAKAYDATGNSKVSAAVAVTINLPVPDVTAPTVSLTSPASGATYTSAQTVTVAVAAADSVAVTKVELYDGTTLKETDSAAPYSFAWAITSANNGSHSLTAKAYDAAGNSKVSSAIPVTVNIAVAKPGSFEFAVGAHTVSENGGYVDVTIDRVGGSDGQVSVDFRTALGTAVNGEDYVGVSQKSLIFVNGETWKTERVGIVNDSVQESEESFKVILSTPTAGATLGAVTESILSILDDDAATPAPPVVNGPVKAFPGAEGFGTDTPAGRGGKIVKVTNLNDSGAGSLREALYNTTGKRIVVFEVAGIINLTSPLVIREPYVTIAGQTAPAPGITLSGYGMRIYTHDVLLQHLFFRGNTTLVDQDCISIQPSGTDRPYNVVVDHCSTAWAYDENISIFPGYTDQTDQNITVSNSLVGEGHYGVLIGSNATRVSFLRNVVLSTVERQPRLGGATYAHVVNNLLYNVGAYEFSAVGSTYGPDQVSYAGNSFVAGPSSRTSVPGLGTSSIQTGSKIYVPVSGAHANTSSYNITSSGITSYMVGTPPVSLDGITITPVTSLQATLATSAGARPAERGTTYGDSVDERFISEILTRSGSVKNRVQPAWSDKPIASTRDIDPLLPANPNGDDNGNGYTNIEEVLYRMALQVEGK
ncbi:MAG: hypothetical protein A2091_12755 [Desulfuromonadales bacterium GWD2_61_12]|nr:MAG: hypothetical protein A2005_11480 [Desulfuromonadales bacterium GWC2_61_20]OGR36553.1 MAG: hypothetical protein A2091_12755 [Desulfuromonadales bacterium GWD2_61_12]